MNDFIENEKIHEECGVIGIYAPVGNHVSREIYYGLLALQHRGQESAGISVSGAALKLKGGYAVIVMSPRKLIAARDPFGIKPLVLGKRGTAYILASESAAIEAAGGELIRDVCPGEIITITGEGIQSDKTLCQEQKAHCVFEYIYFARPDSVIDGISVYDARFRAGQALAKRDLCTQPADFADRIDLVAGVPDSGLVAAEGYAYVLGKPHAAVFHKNSYIGRSFIKPTDRERKNAVHMKLRPLKSVVSEKRILLIDDSIVRGTTMREIIKELKRAGARAVHVRISSPPFLHPCFYGTDVPSTNQLIASAHSSGEVCRKIGADSLAYLQIEDFDRMVGKLSLCMACFDGKYPVQ